MGNFGATFDLELHDAENGFDESHIVSMPGDLMRLNRWIAATEGAEEQSSIDSMFSNYALAWHVLKRRGKLAEYGLPDDLTIDGVMEMADRYTLYARDFDEDKVPLAGKRGK